MVLDLAWISEHIEPLGHGSGEIEMALFMQRSINIESKGFCARRARIHEVFIDLDQLSG